MASVWGKSFGLAFGVAFGVVTTVVTPPEPIQRNTFTTSSGGGGSDAGTGWVKKDHGWVKLTKYARAGVDVHNAIPVAGASADFGQVRSISTVRGSTAQTSSSVLASIFKTSVSTHDSKYSVASSVELKNSLAHAKPRGGSVDWLSADELLMILEACA